jgi:hypothetical protein
VKESHTRKLPHLADAVSGDHVFTLVNLGIVLFLNKTENNTHIQNHRTWRHISFHSTQEGTCKQFLSIMLSVSGML